MSILPPSSPSPTSIPPSPPPEPPPSEIKSISSEETKTPATEETKPSVIPEEDDEDKDWEVLELSSQYFLAKIRGIKNTFVSLKSIDRNNKVVFKNGKFIASVPETLTTGKAIYEDLGVLAGLSKLKDLVVTIVTHALPGGKVAEIAAKKLSLEGALRAIKRESIDNSTLAITVIALTALDVFDDIQMLSQKLNVPEAKIPPKEDKASPATSVTSSTTPMNHEDLRAIHLELIQLKNDMITNTVNMRKLAYPYQNDKEKYEEINQAIDAFSSMIEVELIQTLKEIEHTLEIPTSIRSDTANLNTFSIPADKDKNQFIRDQLEDIFVSLQSVSAITPESGKQSFDKAKEIYRPTLSERTHATIENLATSETTVAAYLGKLLKKTAEPSLRFFSTQNRARVTQGIAKIQEHIIKTINTFIVAINDKSLNAHQITRIRDQLNEIKGILPDVKKGFNNLKIPYQLEADLLTVQTIANLTETFDRTINKAIDNALSYELPLNPNRN